MTRRAAAALVLLPLVLANAADRIGWALIDKPIAG